MFQNNCILKEPIIAKMNKSIFLARENFLSVQKEMRESCMGEITYV